MRKTVIENMWINKEADVSCKVFFNYENGEKPYITIKGYNPFPFFFNDTTKKVYTSLKAFNDWMLNSGWEQVHAIRDIISVTHYIVK